VLRRAFCFLQRTPRQVVCELSWLPSVVGLALDSGRPPTASPGATAVALQTAAMVIFPPSGVDNNPASPFYGRQYAFFNDYNVGLMARPGRASLLMMASLGVRRSASLPTSVAPGR